MNKKVTVALAICCIGGLLFLFVRSCWPALRAPAPQERTLTSSTTTTPVQQPLPVATPDGSAATAPINMQAAHDAEVKREQSLVDLWIMTPITFYGKVVDEKANPVGDAKAVMSAADHPYGNGSKYERTSDANGLFSISGIHGVGLLVNVSKEGYYSLPQSWGNFGYAVSGGDEKPPHTDPNDPAVFVLRKMGNAEPLVVENKNIRIGKTGIPVYMDLHTGKTNGVSSPDIEVQAWTQDQNSVSQSTPHYDWRCVITVPGGGIQPRTGGEFDFTAPENGYQPSDEMSMTASDSNWDSRESGDYFLKLATGEYARINFTMHAGGDHFLSITSYLNLTPGDRNLEYDPAKAIKVGLR